MSTEITRGEKTEGYIKWLTRKGKPEVVIPIRFIDFRKNKHGHLITFYSPDGLPFIGEEWECKTAEGKLKIFTFPVESQYDENVGWEFNRTPLSDELPNLHFDNWEYKDGNYYRQKKYIESDNLQLIEQIIQTIEDEVVGRIAQVKLMLLTTPSLKIYKEWKNIIEHEQEGLERFNLLIKS